MTTPVTGSRRTPAPPKWSQTPTPQSCVPGHSISAVINVDIPSQCLIPLICRAGASLLSMYIKCSHFHLSYHPCQQDTRSLSSHELSPAPC
ncbi:hypothetical protein GDO81_020548 [Engystomops pustulosus]|uniref:Uncharacterized protein n=1 Tax=Engystomops pustulosus TaxID=76066 RepID=A0AAV6YRG3_ENGPU|nr:hypothetical protein GDO81_020548 [Engystomops pustulosus]